MEIKKNILKENADGSREMKRIGIAADHGGFELKKQLKEALKIDGYDVADFGAD